jgi:Flp pilus assembly protein TadG
MVEFAIVLPVFLAITWGVIDFGRLFFTSNSLANAAREGGRYAAVLADPIGSATAVKTRVKQSFVPFGGPGITDAEISIDTTTISGAVIVTITGYPAPVITPLSSLIGTTSTMTRQATFRRERS